MFTTPIFYIGWVIIALLPLTVAIAAPQKSAIRSSLPCAFSLLLSLSCVEYTRKRKTTMTAGPLILTTMALLMKLYGLLLLTVWSKKRMAKLLM